MAINAGHLIAKYNLKDELLTKTAFMCIPQIGNIY